MENTGKKIPYTIVSMAAIIRDFSSPEYVNEIHRKLTDIADSLYNFGDYVVEHLREEYKPYYNEYGKEFFQKVLNDMKAIKSQLTTSNQEELLIDYNDRIKWSAIIKE